MKRVSCEISLIGDARAGITEQSSLLYETEWERVSLLRADNLLLRTEVQREM